MLYSLVEGRCTVRCTYGLRCIFSHDTSRVCCKVRSSVDHIQEECVYKGGGSYDPQLDPNALKEAERAAARNRTSIPKSGTVPMMKSRRNGLNQNWRVKPPSPPKAPRTGARLRPRSDGSGKCPPTPPRAKRVTATSSVRGSPFQVAPPRKREPKRRKEPQSVPAMTRIEGTSPKAEVKQLVPKASVGRSMILAASKGFWSRS